ncbi:hypothetical protein J40TS1_48420 [Paenibacillus montaniterrae]|uniref:ABC transporter domain-containing protein n=1 Tax=Paenibacillus montaniterrae TaxID=429341 RepID=A0A919YT23_9BACL|nr:ATP-binding cassette domain-containing protein [Paenibacillus montaniterrae]GIP19200.1 hypothetical protein J40TS1_48420 [Paenibacillus montaniterrae]
MNRDSLITLKKISKRYGSREVLSNISLSLRQGECIMIRGSNGSGKSTLLKIVAGLIPFTAGERQLAHAKLVIGYAPDHLARLRMTSTEYLTHMGRLSRMPKEQLQTRIEQLHAFFNLEQSKSLKMTHFSKGMLQKVNLMQATLHDPELLVLDEPLSGLDKESVQHLLSSLQQIKAAGTSILAAVHDTLLASELGGTTFWIKQGRLENSNMQAAALHSSQLSSVAAAQKSVEKGAVFELLLELSEQQLQHLTHLFPEVVWSKERHGLMTAIVLQKDYYSLMSEMVQQKIEMISLQRKEVAK